VGCLKKERYESVLFSWFIAIVGTDDKKIGNAVRVLQQENLGANLHLF